MHFLLDMTISITGLLFAHPLLVNEFDHLLLVKWFAHSACQIIEFFFLG